MSQLPQMARIQEEIPKKCRFLRLFKFNERSLSAVDQFQHLLGTTSRIWANLGFCLRFIALIVFDILCSQNLNKLFFFYINLNKNPVPCRSTTTKTWYGREHNIAVISNLIISNLRFSIALGISYIIVGYWLVFIYCCFVYIYIQIYVPIYVSY